MSDSEKHPASRTICPWCGDDCPRWGADACPLRPRQLPREGTEAKWRRLPTEGTEAK